MLSLSALLSQHTCLVADGAWGTELSKLGLGIGEVPETWNIHHQDAVAGIAHSYLEAGAQIVLTNTFGGNRLKLAKAGLADETTVLNQAGAELSRRAVSDEALVFGSIGPTGEFMQPLGTISEQEMIACFAEQVRALVSGGVDGFVIETMSDLGEAVAALKAVRENSTLPAVVSMTFEQGLAGYATIMGVKPGQAVEALSRAGADLIGANCGSGVDVMVGVIRQMAGSSNLPIWAKPNAGLPVLVEGRTEFQETPAEFVAHLPALLGAGARIIGGCCGTTPAHIRALAAVINEAS